MHDATNLREDLRVDQENIAHRQEADGPSSYFGPNAGLPLIDEKEVFHSPLESECQFRATARRGSLPWTTHCLTRRTLSTTKHTTLITT